MFDSQPVLELKHVVSPRSFSEFALNESVQSRQYLLSLVKNDRRGLVTFLNNKGHSSEAINFLSIVSSYLSYSSKQFDRSTPNITYDIYHEITSALIPVLNYSDHLAEDPRFWRFVGSVIEYERHVPHKLNQDGHSILMPIKKDFSDVVRNLLGKEKNFNAAAQNFDKATIEKLDDEYEKYGYGEIAISNKHIAGFPFEQVLNSTDEVLIEKVCKVLTQGIQADIELAGPYLKNGNTTLDRYIMAEVTSRLKIPQDTLTRIVTLWRSHDNVEMLRRNYWRMLQLEAIKPGSTAVLYDEFGIAYFGRYPVDLLAKQFDQRNDDLPFGVWVDSRYDYRRKGDLAGGYALYSEGFTKVFYNSIGQNRVRIIEAGSPRELVARLNQLHRRYNRVFEYGVINGHGGPKIVCLGSRDSQELTKEMLATPLAQQVAGLFRSGCPMAIAACATAKKKFFFIDDNFAASLTRLGFHVTAYAKAIPVYSLEAALDDAGQVSGFKMNTLNQSEQNLIRSLSPK